jgi:peptidoglycan/LPS O-acetylase OafA/YrhL
LACAALGGVVFWEAGRLVHGRLLDPLLLGRSAFFIQDYSPGTLLTGIGPAWSLAVEVVFYCAPPLLGLSAVRLARLRSSRAWRRSAARTSGPVCLGMALAVLRVDSEDGIIRVPRWSRAAAALAALGIYGLTTSMSSNERSSYCPPKLAHGLDSFAFSNSDRSLRGRYFVQHLSLTRAAHSGARRAWIDIRWPLRVHFNLLLAACVTAVASTITYVLVEAPALRLKSRTGRERSRPMPAAQVEAAP